MGFWFNSVLLHVFMKTTVIEPSKSTGRKIEYTNKDTYIKQTGPLLNEQLGAQYLTTLLDMYTGGCTQ